MSLWLLRLCVLCSLCVSTACSRRDTAPPPPALEPQVSGTIDVAGLTAPVRVVRDRWGVPHIYAERQGDLFFAQGFVQAQDRLFQMDLWRRSVQGRLSQVLGANFIDRDAMTRRVQFTGDETAEWASYGPDAKVIATAFVAGINAWIARARERPPEEFVLAGWQPDLWEPADVLNRTDAFTASRDALDEVRRKQLSDVIGDAIRSIGAPPFFAALAAPVRSDAGEVRLQPDHTIKDQRSGPSSDVRGVRLEPDHTTVVTAAHVSATSNELTVSESRARLEHPSARYFVHLHAPGWNVIGATSPWRPGVAVGHNEHIAWGATSIAADTQDIYADPASAPRITVKEAIAVKGRAEPFTFNREITQHGVVIASDRERQIVYTLRWSGTQAGAAPELAALLIDRATDWETFLRALAAWKLPARRIVYADRAGRTGFHDAALVPARTSGEWVGWMPFDRLAHAFNARGGSISAAGMANAAGPARNRQAGFAHPLAVNDAARKRFDVGPVDRPANDNPVRIVFDLRDWDRSRAITAPGQSGAPTSPHFSDLAALWASGEYFPLAFSDAAVQANQEAVLTLTPAGRSTARPEGRALPPPRSGEPTPVASRRR